MNKKDFANCLFTILDNFNCKTPTNMWLDQLYHQTSRFSDNELNKGFAKIFSMSLEDWNKKYGFGGKPAIADWLVFFGAEKPQDITSIAKMQVAKILIEADHFFGGNYQFENPVTNATVKRYGGLRKLNWELFDSSNDKPKQKEWVVKEFVEIWLQCHDGKIFDDKPTILDPATKRIDIVRDEQILLSLN